ncbi:hypothetical protein [Pseudonocardia sp. ICBG1034]|uniref:hypothetical protein n=1 Tax=Pseudonocardia sp. ICBG1034 TaxID=2844381 RepID=UPI001CCE69C2|nr:hypothetical protein [Pseudonocardia sp. ICBG1034]
MTGPGLAWEGEAEDAAAAVAAAAELRELKAHQTGDSLSVGNEFSEIRVSRVETRNGARVLIEAPKSGQWVALCPLEVEALTWQNADTFSAMIGNPFGPLFASEEE